MMMTVNICYLEFVNFGLGASGMVRENLRNNDTVSLSTLFQIMKTISYSGKKLHTVVLWHFSGSSR